MDPLHLTLLDHLQDARGGSEKDGSVRNITKVKFKMNDELTCWHTGLLSTRSTK